MADDSLILGIDSSTTACKAIVWDRNGNAVASGRAEISLHNPEPDGYEQDAEDWWRALVEAVRAALAPASGVASRIVALCIANQRETFVVTDGHGRPLHRALVWMDRRCKREVGELVVTIGAERLHETTGKPPCTTPSLYKLAYLLRRGAPDLAKRRPRVLDVHGFLAWRLTGEFATSLASADPTGMVDMRRRAWAEPIIDALGITVEQLPALVEPGGRLGALSAARALELGLPEGLPVVAGAGDGQCAGLGAGTIESDRAYLNLGTAIVSGVASPHYRVDLGFRTLFGAGGSYFLETDLQGGTFTINWLIDRVLGCSSGDRAGRLVELEHEAAGLGPGSSGLVLVPYFNGVMNPYWDDDARGVIVGLRGHHGPAHLYRAILEGIAFEQRLHTERVEAGIEGAIRELVVLGGGAASDLWCQIVADVLEKAVVRAASTEATSLGAAILGAVGAGFYPDAVTASRAMSSTGSRFEPGEDGVRYAELYRDVYASLYPAVREPVARLGELAS